MLTEWGNNVNPLLFIISQQYFTHAMTAELLYHVQNFITINLLPLGCEQNEISIEFEIRWKNLSWTGPQAGACVSVHEGHWQLGWGCNTDYGILLESLPGIRWLCENFIKHFLSRKYISVCLPQESGPQVLRQKFNGRKRSIPCILMPWLLVSPGHQQQQLIT